MNPVSDTLFPLIALSLLPLIASCQAPENRTSEQKTPRFPAYRVEAINQRPELTRKDQSLAKKIRQHQTQNVTPLEKINRQSDLVRYIESLDTSAPASKLNGTGKTLAEAVNNKSMPGTYFGQWYRLRGTPISTPDDRPFQGHLDTDVSVQQFTMKNPADYDAPEHTMYYVIVSLEDLPASNPTDTILEMDGLLWTTWNLSHNGSARTGDTPQASLPVLFVKNYRIVKQ